MKTGLDVLWGNRRWFRDSNGLICPGKSIGTRNKNWTDYSKMPHGDSKEFYIGDELRREFKLQIVNKYSKSEKVKTSDKPLAILTSGGTASGKTAAVELFLSSPEARKTGGFLRIDFDLIKRDLPEYVEMEKRKLRKAAEYVHRESADIASKIFNKAIKKKCDFVFDSTLVNYKLSLERLQRLKKRGYSIIIVSSFTRLDEAIRRAEARYKQGGRWVPNLCSPQI
jgi:predicted ABC-type ATPase